MGAPVGAGFDSGGMNMRTKTRKKPPKTKAQIRDEGRQRQTAYRERMKAAGLLEKKAYIHVEDVDFFDYLFSPATDRANTPFRHLAQRWRREMS